VEAGGRRRMRNSSIRSRSRNGAEKEAEQTAERAPLGGITP